MGEPAKRKVRFSATAHYTFYAEVQVSDGDWERLKEAVDADDSDSINSICEDYVDHRDPNDTDFEVDSIDFLEPKAKGGANG